MKRCILCNKPLKPFEDNFCEHCVRNKSMGDVYTHLSNKDVKEAVGKTIYKFEDIPKEKKHKLEMAIEELQKENKKLAKVIGGVLEMFTDLKFKGNGGKMIKLKLTEKAKNLIQFNNKI